MKKFPAHAAMGYARRKGWIDVPGGLALMRDASVPVSMKIASLGLGFLMMLVFQTLEIPLQAAVDLMTGLLATPLLLAFDGLEFIVLPVLFGAAILARMAPRPRPVVIPNRPTR